MEVWQGRTGTIRRAARAGPLGLSYPRPMFGVTPVPRAVVLVGSGRPRSRFGPCAARSSGGLLVNVVVVSGVLSSAPVLRVLQSGEELLSCEVTVRSPDRPAETIPVVWPDPPASGSGVLAAGLEVVVTGRVRRRFFRSAGATSSRTEVVAEAVVLSRRRKRANEAIDAAAGNIVGV